MTPTTPGTKEDAFMRTRYTALAAIFCVFVVAIWLRYRDWMFPVLYGDDLTYYVAFLAKTCATAPADILTSVCQERFRPVASSTVIALMHLFGSKMLGYQVANGLILASIGVLTFLIAKRLSEGAGKIAFFIAATVVVSRFATYHATQMIAPVESLALLASLGAVYAVVRADGSPQHAWRWSWAAIACAFLAIHTHERFVVVAAWLFGAFVLSPGIRALRPHRLGTLLAACLGLPVFYIAYKRLVLDTMFMVGTGGSYIDFDVPRILGFAGDAALSLFGFNTGPEYLVGNAVGSGLDPMLLCAIVFAGAWVFLVGSAIRRQLRGLEPGSGIEKAWMTLDRLHWPILLLSLAAFLLFPTLITIHLEHRWLFAPFTILMLLAAWASAHIARRRALVLAATMAVSSIAVDSLAMRGYDGVFMVYSPRFATKVKQDVIDADPAAKHSLILLAAGAQCNWTLLDGAFFRIYGGAYRPIYCEESLESAVAANRPGNLRVYGEGPDGRLKDLTSEYEKLRRDVKEASFDFVQRFPEGRIDNPGNINIGVDGARILPWDTASGTKAVALTVVSGFSYVYSDVPVGDREMLSFDVAMLYPASQPARAVVRALGADGTSTTLFARVLQPPGEGSAPAFQSFEVPLAQYAGQRVTIAFATETPGNDPTGHWIGFARPRIVKAIP